MLCIPKAYQYRLTPADPSGFTLTAGGPRTTFVAPAAREYAPSATTALGGAPTLGGPVQRLALIMGDPPFKVKGPNLKKNTPGLDRSEFVRQLANQQQGLNRLTVAEFLANRQRYTALRKLTGTGRDPKGDAAQKVARARALNNKILELRRQDPKLNKAQAAAMAQ